MLIPDTQLHKDQAGESEVHGHPQVCSILEYVKTLATKNLLWMSTVEDIAKHSSILPQISAQYVSKYK